MSKKAAGIGILALLGLGVFAFANRADAADDDDDDDDDDDGDDDDDDGGIDPIDFDPYVEPPPPPPNPLVCNYVGCGELNPPGAPDYNWPFKSEFPTYVTFGFALEQLGYVQSPAPISPDWSIISGAFMSTVRDFQRDYNAVRDAASGAFQASHPRLDTDGLIGNMTIAAIRTARQLVATRGMSWEAIVDEAS